MFQRNIRSDTFDCSNVDDDSGDSNNVDDDDDDNNVDDGDDRDDYYSYKNIGDNNNYDVDDDKNIVDNDNDASDDNVDSSDLIIIETAEDLGSSEKLEQDRIFSFDTWPTDAHPSESDRNQIFGGSGSRRRRRKNFGRIGTSRKF